MLLVGLCLVRKVQDHGEQITSVETGESWKQTKRLRRNTLNVGAGGTDMFIFEQRWWKQRLWKQSWFKTSSFSVPLYDGERLGSSENIKLLFVLKLFIFSRLNIFWDVAGWRRIEGGRGRMSSSRSARAKQFAGQRSFTCRSSFQFCSHCLWPSSFCKTQSYSFLANKDIVFASFEMNASASTI